MKKIYVVVVTVFVLLAAGNHTFTRETESVSGTAYEQKVESVAFGYALEQAFVPAQEYIKSISIYVETLERETDHGKLVFRIQDEMGEDVFDTAIDIAVLPPYGWQEIIIDKKFNINQTYTIIVESQDCVDLGPKIFFCEALLAATPEQQGYSLSYAGNEVDNTALRIKFKYEMPLAWYEYVIYGLFALAVGFVILDWKVEEYT